MAELYSHFSHIYDSVMSKVPYLKWAHFLKEKFQEQKIHPKHFFLEIACGTGILLSIFEEWYKNIAGMDISMNMLRQAQTRSNSCLVNGNMTRLPFPDSSFHGIFCAHDSINYLKTRQELRQHFEEVYRILFPEGVYIFDITTEKNVLKNYHNKSFTEQHNGIWMKWSNDYRSSQRQIISTIKFYESFSRVRVFKNKIQGEETHIQTLHSEEEVETTLQKEGFKIIKKFSDYDIQKELKYANLLVYVIKK